MSFKSTLVAVPDLRDAVALGVGDGPRLVTSCNGVDDHLRVALGWGDEAHVGDVGRSQDTKLDGIVLLGGHWLPEDQPVAAQSTQE